MPEWEEQAKKLAKAMPWWGWAASGGVALGGVYYLRTHSSGAKGVPASSASTTGAQPEYQAPDGLAMSDLAGLPFDYYDWSAANAPGGEPLPPTDNNPNGTPSAPVGYPGGHLVPVGMPTGFPYAPPLPGPIRRIPSGTPINPPGLPPIVPGGVAQPLVSQTTTPPGTTAGATQAAPAVYHHTVEAFPAWDSTLSGIAAHYGMSWQALYNYGNDREIIDRAAEAHGHYSQEDNWLFPGEQLEVPSPN